MSTGHGAGSGAAGQSDARGLLEELARLHGIDCVYDDAFGTRRAVSDATLFALLRALGVPVSAANDLRPALDARRRQLAARVVEPVTVAWDGKLALPLRLGDGRGEAAERPVDLTVELEGGEARSWRLTPQPAAYWERSELSGLPGRSGSAGPAGRTAEGGGLPIAPPTHVLRPPEPLPLGYHRARLSGLAEGMGPGPGGGPGGAGGVPTGETGGSGRTRERSGEILVIAAPRRAYGAGLGPWDEGTADTGRTGQDRSARRWGTFLPLYALRTARSWGTGDLTDLEDLLAWTRELGGSMVGTLPLFAAFLGAGREPFDPSPYAPASRLFWNELFVDPERAPGLEAAPGARKLLESEAFRDEIAALRRADTVDYREAARAKRRVLTALAEAAFGVATSSGAPGEGGAGGRAGTRARGSGRHGSGVLAAALEQHRRDRPEAEEYAAFRARTEREGPWSGWNGGWNGGRSGASDGTESSGAVHRTAGGAVGRTDDGPGASAWRYHLYVQWLAERQMTEVAQSGAGAAEHGLYLDLPLGVHGDSYDLWRHRELFATGASVGAPPDPFFVQGQSWGFPPLHPERQRRDGYRYLRQVLATAMGASSVLRIDHVMSLHRLFWVPAGRPATEGAYVHYPAEELYALMTLESHRHRTVLVGEDLGTVPEVVERSLPEHGIFRMHVLQFALSGDEAKPVGEIPDDVLAALDTHDTPTFPAFLDGLDLTRRRDRRSEDGQPAVEDALEDAAEGAAQERAGRAEVRRALARFLERRGLLAESPGPASASPEAVQKRDKTAAQGSEQTPSAAAVSRAALELLAESPAPLVLVNLEDLWGETEPQNVPGTGLEAGNWQRKARRTLDEIKQDPEVIAVADRIDAKRKTTQAKRTTKKGPKKASESKAPMSKTQAIVNGPALAPYSPITDDDVFLFNEGRHFRLYDRLGARLMEIDGPEGKRQGVYFAVWAPSASRVSVIGDFNAWRAGDHPLTPLSRGAGSSGLWEGFVPGLAEGALYKLHIVSGDGSYQVDKADPFAVQAEEPPKTGSVVRALDYAWGDDDWMAGRAAANRLDAPIAIYEVHPGSWRRVPEEGGRPLTYREMAPQLAEHVKRHHFTHVELLPIMEHPFYGSWGYQTTAYFAPTSRYGSPQDFMFLVDHLHQEGIGVILDWVPSHFPADEHGLSYFDGTHLFEHADPRQGFHPDWGSLIFNYGRHEVRSFLISSALSWLERYHVDGLRVDAVASMLYLDYSRKDGEWIPNEHGGRENLAALSFLRQLNEEIYRSYPDVQTFAEESTAWPMVSRPTYLGGLGFGLKWDMGWMHDTLLYMEREPVHRKYHQGELTFRMIYAFTENFCLPLSHDEVVHGKGSLLSKMPGPDWEQFANLRLLYGYMTAQPAKKLLFMGAEIAQRREWSHEGSLDWHLLGAEAHAGISCLVADLNRVYRAEPALHQLDTDPAGFEWLAADDAASSVLAFLRKGKGSAGDRGDLVACVFNFTPIVRHNYRLGVPRGGRWQEILNTDATAYWGSGQGNLGGVEAAPVPSHGRTHSLHLTLPPLAAVFLKNSDPLQETS